MSAASAERVRAEQKLPFIVPYRLGRSVVPPAAVRRAGARISIRAGLACVAACCLLAPALAAYVLLYAAQVPSHLGFALPVHLASLPAGISTDISTGMPSGISSGMAVIQSRYLAAATEYAVAVELVLPRSPANLAAGSFVVELRLVDTGAGTTGTGTVLVEAARLAALTYWSPVTRAVRTWLRMPAYAIGWAREVETLRVPLLERVAFGRAGRSARGSTLPNALQLAVKSSAGAGPLQLYSARVDFSARLTGLRWVMYRHRLVSFAVLSVAFWYTAVLFALGTWLFLSLLRSAGGRHDAALARPRKGRPAATIDPAGLAPEKSEAADQAGSALLQPHHDTPPPYYPGGPNGGADSLEGRADGPRTFSAYSRPALPRQYVNTQTDKISDDEGEYDGQHDGMHGGQHDGQQGRAGGRSADATHGLDGAADVRRRGR